MYIYFVIYLKKSAVCIFSHFDDSCKLSRDGCHSAHICHFSFEVVIASLTDFTGQPDSTHMGTVVAAPSGLASFFNEPKPPPSFVPVYNSGIVYGPVDSNGEYLFAYGDFSDANDAKFLSVYTYIFSIMMMRLLKFKNIRALR